MSQSAQPGLTSSLRRRIDFPVAMAFGCIVILLFLAVLVVPVAMQRALSRRGQ